MRQAKQMYCDYRKHTYNIGDLVYIDRTMECDYKDHGDYGRIVEFRQFDNCNMVTYEVIVDSEGNKPLMYDTSTVYVGNIRPAEEAIKCKINELQDQIDFFKELLKNEQT